LEITRKKEFGDYENMIQKQERGKLGILKNDKNGGKEGKTVAGENGLKNSPIENATARFNGLLTSQAPHHSWVSLWLSRLLMYVAEIR
jgi:hypothetical protein